MIALQARNPQLPDPAQRTARLANMMNMARQAEAAQLQGARTRQEMQYAEAAEGRAAQTHTSSQKEAELKYVGLATEQFRQDVAKLKEGDIAGAEALRADIVAKIPSWNNYIRPASEWTPEYTAQLMSKASEIVAQTYPDAKATIEYAAAGGKDAQGRPVPEGTPIQVVTGRRPSTTPISAAGGAATPTAPQAAAPAPASVGEFGEARFVNPESIPLTPYQQEHIREMQNGLGMSQPASFSPSANAAQMTPDVMSRIVNSAFETGVMAQVDFDQLLASQAPQNKQALMDSFRRANITLQADAPSLADSAMGQEQPMAVNPVQTPQSRTANLGGDMPMMRSTEAQYIPVQRRDPNVSPYPGSAQVPLARVAGEAAAQEGGKQGARVKAEPVIAGATKTAQLRAEKDAAFSDAQSQFDAAYTTVNNRLSDIKRFKAHPAATRVIGPLDAFTPNFGRARGAQQIYDTLVASATFDALQEMRINSPTGGALGNVSDADIRLLKESIGALGQAQNEEDFFESLRIYEDRLKQVRDRLVNRYRQSYGYRLSKDWKPPVTSSQPRTPTKAGRKAGGFTVTEVDE
jgi:hypothetical protein